jgi:hypothetical protein
MERMRKGSGKKRVVTGSICALDIALVPGSAAHREARCTASGTRSCALAYFARDIALDPGSAAHHFVLRSIRGTIPKNFTR